MPLKVLFIGGTGQISLPCVHRALSEGHDVSVFNRGQRGAALPSDVNSIEGDMTDTAAYGALGGGGFDVVCQFIAFRPDQIERDIATFAGKCGQYVFISSASVYEKPPSHYIITEKTPTVNPYWKYSQDKIACEALLKASTDLAWTIVRPSHTVRTSVPSMMGENDVLGFRMLAGKSVIVAGDGTTPWTLTRCTDFAVPFVGLFDKPDALGEDFHITSDRAYGWDDIYKSIAKGLGVEANIVHVPTDTLVRYNKDWEGPLTGDKSWAAFFDNSKVKRVAGEFTCSENIDEVLSESIANFKKRLAQTGPQESPLDPLLDRIAKEQSALGAA